MQSFRAVVAQLVERVLGKDEVTSSILVNGSMSFPGRDLGIGIWDLACVVSGPRTKS